MMVNKIRVKAAYLDKGSGRFFDNLTPVSTWVEPTATVGDLLPTLTKRFWAVVASEVLDDDDGDSPKVAISLQTGCLHFSLHVFSSGLPGLSHGQHEVVFFACWLPCLLQLLIAFA